MTVLASSNYPFLNIFWTMLIFFAWVAWIWIAVTVLIDLFRRRDLSGWAKAAWVLFLVFIPFLTALIYLIARGKGMAERQIKAIKEQQTATETYIRDVASKSPADHISDAKALLDAGTITPDEFNALKAKALA